MSTRTLSTLLVAAVGCWLLPLVVHAADKPKDDGPNKRAAVRWVNSYGQDQVLFNTKDMERLKSAVEAMNEEQATRWMEQTENFRKSLASPDWIATRTWLKEFLRVQAIYSDEQIAAKRAAAARMTPSELQKMMENIEGERGRMASASSNAAAVRKQQLEINRHFEQEQATARHRADMLARQAPPTGIKPDRPITPQDPQRFQRPPPLVSSLDAARWGIYNAMYPGRIFP